MAGVTEGCYFRIKGTRRSCIQWVSKQRPILFHPAPSCLWQWRQVFGYLYWLAGSVHDTRMLKNSPEALEVDSTFVLAIITCCASLHNICLGVGDIEEPVQEARRDNVYQAPLAVEVMGAVISVKRHLPLVVWIVLTNQVWAGMEWTLLLTPSLSFRLSSPSSLQFFRQTEQHLMMAARIHRSRTLSHYLQSHNFNFHSVFECF